MAAIGIQRRPKDRKLRVGNRKKIKDEAKKGLDWDS